MAPSLHRLLPLSLVLLVLSLAAACGDDDGDATATPGSTATAAATPAPESPTAAPTVTPTQKPANRTGNPAIDNVLDAVASKDTAKLRGLVQFVRVECAAQPLGAGGPPECPAGTADKTVVEVFPASVCQGFYSFPNDVAALIQATLDESPRLVAVFRPTAPGTAVFPAGDFVALFERTSGQQKGWMTSFGVSAAGKLVNQAGGCAQTPAQFLQERVPAANVVLGPLPN